MGEHGAPGNPGIHSYTVPVCFVLLLQYLVLINSFTCYLSAGAPGLQGFQGEAGVPGAKGSL